MCDKAKADNLLVQSDSSSDSESISFQSSYAGTSSSSEGTKTFSVDSLTSTSSALPDSSSSVMILLTKAKKDQLENEEVPTKDASGERKQDIIAENVQINTIGEKNELTANSGASQATCIAQPLLWAKRAQFKMSETSTNGAADEVVNSATKRMPWSKSMGLKADAQKPVGDAKSYNEAAAAVNVDAPDTKRMPWSKPPELKGSGPRVADTMKGPSATLMHWSKPLAVTNDDLKAAAHKNAKTYKPRPKSEGKAPVPKYKVHPLLSSWALWYHRTERDKPWEECLHMVGIFDTVEGFWNLFDAVQPPSGLNWNSDYFVFREGIKPMWEDEANKRGGRWAVKNVPSDKLDAYWLNLLLAMIGMEFEPHGKLVCGAAISLWTTDSLNDEANMEIGNILKEELEIPDSDPLRYEVHQDVSNRVGSCVKPRLWLPMRNPTSALNCL